MSLEILIEKLRGLSSSPADDSGVWRTLMADPWVRQRLRGQVIRARRAWCLPFEASDDVFQDAAVRLSNRHWHIDLTRAVPQIARFLSRAFGWAAFDAAAHWQRQRLLNLDQVDEPAEREDTCPEVWELLERLPAEQKDLVQQRLEGTL